MFGRRNNDLNMLENDKIDPLYNIDNYAQEVKYRLQIAYRNASILIEEAKVMNKIIFDKKAESIELNLNNKIILVDETRNKHDSIYKGPYVVTRILDPNIEILDVNTNKLKIVQKNNARKYLT